MGATSIIKVIDRSFKAHRPTAQSISSGVNTKVQYNTEDFDTLGDYDHVTNFRHTPSQKGKWLYYAQAVFNSTASGTTLVMELQKNGGIAQDMRQDSDGEDKVLRVTSLVEMNGTTDFMEVFIFQDSGGAIDIAFAVTASRNFFFAIFQAD